MLQFVFEYRKGKDDGGDVALDDIQITYKSCDPEPPTTGTPSNGKTYCQLLSLL